MAITLCYILQLAQYDIQCMFVCLFDWVLRHTDTVKVIWRRSSFTGGGRPKVPFCALFQA
jgi:hypothetical protein